MGNCMDRCAPRLQKEEERSCGSSAKLRSLVLTMQEFEWLKQQLKQKPAHLETLLAPTLEEPLSMEEDRWQPVLSNITEVPEIQSVESSPEQPKSPPLSLS